MDVLRDRTDLVLRETVERVAHHVELVVEVSGAGARNCDLVGETGQEHGVAVPTDELECRGERARFRTPARFSTQEPGAEVTDRVGDERQGE